MKTAHRFIQGLENDCGVHRVLLLLEEVVKLLLAGEVLAARISDKLEIYTLISGLS